MVNEISINGRFEGNCYIYIYVKIIRVYLLMKQMQGI